MRVIVANTGATPITPVRYRRVVDWDLHQFQGYETVQPRTGDTSFISGVTNDGYADPDPSYPLTDKGINGKMFTIYYGVATGEAAALSAVDAVGAQVYSLGQINTDGSPFTAIMAIDGSNLTNPPIGPHVAQPGRGRYGASAGAEHTQHRTGGGFAMTGRRPRWPWVLAAVAAIAVACRGVGLAYWDEIGCRLPLMECLERDDQLYVRNDRADEITIMINASSIRVPPGQLRGLGDLACGDLLLVATDPAGKEVARFTGDEDCHTRTWIFAPDGSVRLEPGRVATIPS